MMRDFRSIGAWFAAAACVVSLVAGCKRLKTGAVEHFAEEHACPEDRIEVEPREGLRRSQFEGQREEAPAEVRSDPQRLAMWQTQRDESDERLDAACDIFAVRGCGHEAILCCNHPSSGRHTSIGRVSCLEVSVPAVTEKPAVVKPAPVATEELAVARPAGAPNDLPTRSGLIELKPNVISNGDLRGSGDAKVAVSKVLKSKGSAVRQCYEQALRNNPDEGGEVKVSFTVDTAGTVTEVNISGAAGGFAGCIRGKFMGIRGLPLLPAPQSFTQSYVFNQN